MFIYIAQIQFNLSLIYNSQHIKPIRISQMNKTINSTALQSPYYDYLDAMVAVAPSVFNKDAESNFYGLVEYRGDVARSIADSVMSSWKIYENRKDDPRYYRAAFIYLLSYVEQYRDEVRETKNGWVDPLEWCLKQMDENSEIYKLVLQCEHQANIQFN